MMFQADVHARKPAKPSHAPAARLTLMYNAQPDVMQAASAISRVSIDHGSTCAVALCCVNVTCECETSVQQSSHVSMLLPCSVNVGIPSFFEIMCHIEARLC